MEHSVDWSGLIHPCLPLNNQWRILIVRGGTLHIAAALSQPGHRAVSDTEAGLQLNIFQTMERKPKTNWKLKKNDKQKRFPRAEVLISLIQIFKLEVFDNSNLLLEDI